MKNRCLTVLMTVCATLILALPTWTDAQEAESELQVIWDIVVHPSKIDEFESAAKKELVLYEKQKFPHAWWAASTQDYHYYYGVRVESLAEVDELNQAFEKAAKNMGADYAALQEKYSGTFDSARMFMWSLDNNLSYRPKNPRLQPEEAPFVSWSFIYFKGGMDEEVKAISKKWKALYERKNVPNGYSLLVGGLGTDMPVICVVENAKSAADFYSQDEKTKELLGDEGKALMTETNEIIRKFEHKMGRERPDLSYTPATRTTDNEP